MIFLCIFTLNVNGVVVYLPQLSNDMSVFRQVVGMIHHIAHETLGHEKKQIVSGPYCY
jgi:hypothetical protein